eukprot:CAMPEP_0181327396 /NCGR_PEP_ID=MMETSP1101-20121128/22079_1 /TAXON_ID=46948 /ORGANISM="Rhodomonas abbreviata, Strain Caron Lab Isolate" /LENGTH=216 /DNA_ID=CAMNT_0023436053 /DNA_START=34 /DNA_END=684 /DNA_ORIENTATION=-
MPKKESAKERAAGKAADAEAAAAKAAEDASWADAETAKKGAKKMSAEEKRLDDLRRKQERDMLEAEEAASLTPAKKAPAKKTAFEVKNAFIIPPKTKKEKAKKPEPVEENINHVIRDAAMEAAAKGVAVHEASGVDGATELLQNLRTGQMEPVVDAHPERRRKAAFAAYEEREIPRLREENKGLKLSQIKEIIFKNWQKSPENPMNEAELAAAGGL